MSQTNFSPVCENGVLIEPWSDVNVFNFDNTQRLIDSGYAATLRMIPEIKKQIETTVSLEDLEKRRSRYKNYQKLNGSQFTDLKVVGFSKKQTQFITKSLIFNQEPFTLSQLKKRYFRLASEDKIKSVFPVASMDSSSGKYTLSLIGKKEKPFYFEPGAIISNRPISEAFLGLQYNHLGKIGFSAYANGYLGKLHTSTFERLRFDIPGRIPFL